MIVLGLALAMRLLLVGEEPFLSTDIYRYIWDGRVQAAGINPYAHVPADPALAALRDAAIYPFINRADYAVTAYPPIAEMFFLAVTRIAETLTMMRLAMVGCEIAIVAVLIDLLRRLDLPVVTVAAYACIHSRSGDRQQRPCRSADGLADELGVWLLVRARHVAGAIAVALAVTVKPYALFILPAFWRRFDWRVPLAVVAAIVLCYLPYMGAGKGVLGYLTGGYLAEEGLTSGEGIWLTLIIQTLIGKIPGLTATYVVLAAGIMIWLALRAASRAEPAPREAIADVILLLTAGLALMSPNYAWYFLALVPFIPLGAGAPAWALTLGAFLLYKPIYLPHNELIWKTLATLPFLIALVVIWRTRSPRLQPAPAPVQPIGDEAIVSVVIPCLNEEDAIPGVVLDVLAQGPARSSWWTRLDRATRRARVRPLHAS